MLKMLPPDIMVVSKPPQEQRALYVNGRLEVWCDYGDMSAVYFDAARELRRMWQIEEAPKIYAKDLNGRQAKIDRAGFAYLTMVRLLGVASSLDGLSWEDAKAVRDKATEIYVKM